MSRHSMRAISSLRRCATTAPTRKPTRCSRWCCRDKPPALVPRHAQAALARLLIASPCPSPPASGGEGGARRGSVRRVRWVGLAGGNAGLPHLTLTLSAPKGGEGNLLASCLGYEICASPGGAHKLNRAANRGGSG